MVARSWIRANKKAAEVAPAAYLLLSPLTAE